MPLNPQWAEQRDQHVLPPEPKDENLNACVRHPDIKGQCTAEDTLVDDQTPNLFWRALCAVVPGSKIHGHVDWIPSTFYGAVNWIHVNFGDGDYNFRMFPYDGSAAVQNGLTKNNNSLDGTQYIEMEFDSAETGNHFQTRTWREFDAAANSLDDADMKRWLDPQHHETSPFAVVTGLFNLDCEHDCRSELHPLYVLAVETNSSPGDNTWAILLRNWGNGGSCSGFNQQLQLPQNQFHLLLPHQGGKPKVLWDKVEFAVSDQSIQFPTQAYIAGSGYVLTFTLPDPDSSPLVELVLHLQWPAGTPAPPRMKLALPVHPAMMADAIAPPAGSEEDAETYLHSLFTRVGAKPGAVLGVRMEALAPLVKDQTGKLPRQAPTTQFRAPKSAKVEPGQPAPFNVKSVSDPEKEKRDNNMFRSLCGAYRAKGQQLPTDKIPQLPALCESVEIK